MSNTSKFFISLFFTIFSLFVLYVINIETNSTENESVYNESDKQMFNEIKRGYSLIEEGMYKQVVEEIIGEGFLIEPKDKTGYGRYYSNSDTSAYVYMYDMEKEIVCLYSGNILIKKMLK